MMRALTIVSVVLMLVVLIVPWHDLTARFQIIPREVGGASDRSIFYRTAFELVSQHPLFGVGEQAFMSEMGHQIGVPRGPHSNVLSVLLGSGMLGLITLLWLLLAYVTFLRTKLVLMRWSPVKIYAIGVCAGLVGFQIQGLFIANMSWFLLWGMCAIPVCCTLVANDREAGASV